MKFESLDPIHRRRVRIGVRVHVSLTPGVPRLLIDSSRTRFFIYAITLHRKRSQPLGPPPIAWLSAQACRRMGQCSARSYVTVEAVSTC